MPRQGHVHPAALRNTCWYANLPPNHPAHVLIADAWGSYFWLPAHLRVHMLNICMRSLNMHILTVICSHIVSIATPRLSKRDRACSTQQVLTPSPCDFAHIAAVRLEPFPPQTPAPRDFCVRIVYSNASRRVRAPCTQRTCLILPAFSTTAVVPSPLSSPALSKSTPCSPHHPCAQFTWPCKHLALCFISMRSVP